MELDRTIGPFLHLRLGVDQILHTSGIKVGNSSKVKDNSLEYRLDHVSLYNRRRVLLAGSWVIPRSVARCNLGVVTTSPGYLLGLFDKSVIDIRSVRVEERLFESVDYDAGRRVLNLDIFPRRFFIKGNVDISDVLKGVTSLRLDSYTPEEVTFGSSDTKKQENDRGGKRPIDT